MAEENNSQESNSQANNSDTNFIGSIDTIEAGIVYGWAFNKGSAEPVNVKVIAEERVLGFGVANEFRDDLADAKIGNGAHGFKIDLEELPVNDSREITYTIVNADTHAPIGEASFTRAQPDQVWNVKVIGEQHGHVALHVESNKPIGQKTFLLFHENQQVSSKTVVSDKKSIEINLVLPLVLADGNDHLVKVGITGFSYIVASGIINAQTIKTPWQYLKESANTPGCLSLSKQSDKRYESLAFHLQDLTESKSYFNLQDLNTVHKLLTEGYEGRSVFPAFNLPKFNKPTVSIIIPAYNQFALTYHCIASIALAYNKTSFEVILADDCSTDETADASSIIGNLVVSRTQENLRFLRNCNEAAKVAKGEFIVFLNNDTEVTSFWLDELVNKHNSDPQIGMTGSKLLNLDGSIQEAGGIVWNNGVPWNVGRNLNPLTPEYNYAREVDYVTGASMCIRRSVWNEVGAFSEELVPCYYEDTDLAFKVRAAGYKTVYVPHSEVVHFEGQSHGVDVTKGLKRYQIINESIFREKWFKTFKHNGKLGLDNLRFEKDRNVEQRILLIDYASPMPNKDAGSYAAIQEIKLIQSLGFKVTFVPANLAHFGKYTTDLQRMGVEVLYAPFYHSVNHVLETRLDEFSAVYITRYHIAKDYIDYIHNNSDAKVIFNNADLHFLRELRSALKPGAAPELLEIAKTTRTIELNVCEKADAILCYNATEHAVITSHILEAEKLHITPWVLEQKPVGPDFKSRNGIAFLGGFNHTPNAEAVEYLAKDIMPLLGEQRPDITLYVYGSSMPKEFEKYNTSNIKMLGFAETLDGVYHDHRIFVAPLLSGAGIKGKVLEAMAYGTPTVLTEVAAEGTGLSHGISTLIAQEPQEWVDAIIKLYDDKTLWAKFVENEQTIVNATYSFEHGHKAFKKIFASVGVYSSK